MDYLEKHRIPWPFDMAVIDKLSSFKNHQSQRWKALKKVRPKIHRIVGLTGTPAGNGLMDLWAETCLIDNGQRLGRFIGRYRDPKLFWDEGNWQPLCKACHDRKTGCEDSRPTYRY